MAGISETLRNDLRDAEFAEVYAETFLDTYVATQIKVLREQREMTQVQLAALLGTTQTVVSRIESVNYSAWNIKTLKKLARALKVRLRVSFETYGSLIGDMERFDRTTLQRPALEDDPVLQGEPATPEQLAELVALMAVGEPDVTRIDVFNSTRDMHDRPITRPSLLDLVPKPSMLRAAYSGVPQQPEPELTAYGRR